MMKPYKWKLSKQSLVPFLSLNFIILNYTCKIYRPSLPHSKLQPYPLPSLVISRTFYSLGFRVRITAHVACFSIIQQHPFLFGMIDIQTFYMCLPLSYLSVNDIGFLVHICYFLFFLMMPKGENILIHTTALICFVMH